MTDASRICHSYFVPQPSSLHLSGSLGVYPRYESKEETDIYENHPCFNNSKKTDHCCVLRLDFVRNSSLLGAYDASVARYT